MIGRFVDNPIVGRVAAVLYRRLDRAVDDAECLAAAAEIYLAAGFMRHLDFPNEQHCTAELAAKELQKISSLCTKLNDHIGSLHLTALQAIETTVAENEFWRRLNGGRWTDPRLMLMALRSIGALAAEAAKHIPEPTRVQLSSTDPKRKRAPLEVGVIVAKVFERLTTKRATISIKDGKPYGEFFELLREIYRVLGIKASAHNMGVEAARAMKLSRLKQC